MQPRQSDPATRAGAPSELERRLVAEASSAFSQPPAGFPARVMDAVEIDRPAPSSGRRLTPLALGWAALAAAAIAVVGAVRFAGPGLAPPDEPSATAAISSALDAVPSPSRALARLVSAPVRAETEALAERTRRVADALPIRLAARPRDHE